MILRLQMPRTRSQSTLHSATTSDHVEQKISINSTKLNTNDMADNVSTNDTVTELKELILSMKKDMHDMKQEIMVKLTENQKDIQEMKDELKTLKSTVVEVEKATSFHAEKNPRIGTRT